MADIINILCATDDNYAPFCGIMLTSLFENNKEEDIHVYLLEDDSPVSNKNRGKLLKLCDCYHQRISFVYVDNSSFRKYPTHGYTNWKTNVYYRLLAADILPQDINKVIYLDCDMIITSSLRGLWNISLTDYALAGSLDPGTFNPEFYERLGLDSSVDYINGGMLLINLEYWRKQDIGRKCLDYLVANHKILNCNDQDIINVVLQGRRKTIPCTYNYMIYSLRSGVFECLSKSMQTEMLSVEKPIIIHYCDTDKPWQITYYHKPFYKEWNYYKKTSLWRHTSPLLPNRHLVRKMVKRVFLWPLGLCLNLDNKYVKSQF